MTVGKDATSYDNGLQILLLLQRYLKRQIKPEQYVEKKHNGY